MDRIYIEECNDGKVNLTCVDERDCCLLGAGHTVKRVREGTEFQRKDGQKRKFIPRSGAIRSWALASLLGICEEEKEEK